MKGLIKKRGIEAEFLPEKNAMIIDSSLKGEDRDHAILHELGHALFVRGSLLQANISSDLQEIICDQFATMFLENFVLTKK